LYEVGLRPARFDPHTETADFPVPDEHVAVGKRAQTVDCSFGKPNHLTSRICFPRPNLRSRGSAGEALESKLEGIFRE
jgi:hypothetical protein